MIYRYLSIMSVFIWRGNFRLAQSFL